MNKPRVYLAGPDVFRADPATHFAEAKRILALKGMTGLSPFDSEYSGSESGPAQGSAIYKANIKLIDSCQAVLANVSPFRGPSIDPGTAFEIGYAVAKGIPVFAYSDTGLESYRARIDHLKNLGVCVVSDTYPGVEDFGLADNLMIACSVQCYRDAFISAMWRCHSVLLEKGLILNEPHS